MTELERLARIEEQVLGIREDIGRVEVTLASATKIFADLHISYVPRQEIVEMRINRNKEQADQDTEIEKLKKVDDEMRVQIERLNRKWAWLAGLGSAVMIALTVLQIYNGFSKGG